ncbi:MAG: Gmad2 immunoglobulin-like domain-containing protein [Chloroflexi bacterium]|nr:Gmad2 immunoglobulin-like domain-containing protein [Chloroflexota bacterium]
MRSIALAAALVLVGVAAVAVILVGRPAGPAEPAASAHPTGTAATETAVPVQAVPVPKRVWFARDQLPPIAAMVLGAGGPNDSLGRISSRIGALRDAQSKDVPPGAINVVALIGTFKQDSVGVTSQFETGGRVDGDLLTLELGRGQFDRIRGALQTQAVVQQLVYTATEEPGISRVLLTERGGARLTIDQLEIDKPLTREDVMGYPFSGAEAPSIAGQGVPVQTEVPRWSFSNDAGPGLGRFSLELRAKSVVTGGRLDPTVRVSLSRCDACGSRWQLRVDLPDAEAPSPAPPFQEFVAGPIRSFDVPHTRGPADLGTIFLLGLDDARPWRVTTEPTGAGTARINVDIGGRPQLLTRNIAVYVPDPDATMTRSFTLSGAARVFEANVIWRIRDASGRAVAQDHTTATIGTSPVWGTFATTATVPASVSGQVTLEVFWASPKDGAEMDLISIALTVR